MKNVFSLFFVGFLFYFVVVGVFCLDVYAGHTEIGKPYSLSYVKDKNSTVIIYVGDSRTMMLSYKSGNRSERDNYYLCWVNGGRIDCIYSHGSLTPYLNRAIKKYRNRCVVVFNLGVNGNSSPYDNADNIIRTYSNWMSKYKDVPFYVESLNPTTIYTGSYSNWNVEIVNERLKHEFSECYIDTYNYLKRLGYGLSGKGMRGDIHYGWQINKRILIYTKSYIIKQNKRIIK